MEVPLSSFGSCVRDGYERARGNQWLLLRQHVRKGRFRSPGIMIKKMPGTAECVYNSGISREWETVRDGQIPGVHWLASIVKPIIFRVGERP